MNTFPDASSLINKYHVIFNDLGNISPLIYFEWRSDYA